MFKEVCRSPYRRAEMYAGRVACCRLVSYGEYADGTDRQTDKRTDARQLHYAFRYRCGQRNKWSKNFDERPHRRLATPSGCEWIRPILTRIFLEICCNWFLGSTWVSPQNGISIGSAIFARPMNVTNRQASIHTDRSRYTLCSNRPYLMQCMRRGRTIRGAQKRGQDLKV